MITDAISPAFPASAQATHYAHHQLSAPANRLRNRPATRRPTCAFNIGSVPACGTGVQIDDAEGDLAQPCPVAIWAALTIVQ